MKKYLSVIAVAALATYGTSAFGQGLVLFSNGTGVVNQWKSSTDQTLTGVPKNGGFVQLYWAAVGAAYTPWSASLTPAAWYAANPAWTLQGTAQAFNTPAAGKFNGGTLSLAPRSANIDYVVIGWTGVATTFDAALNAGNMVGVSAKFTSITGDGGSIPPGTAVPLSTSFAGMTLQPVPEPTTLALAGLGAAALVIFRRRK